jgi:hypothetical protein
VKHLAQYWRDAFAQSPYWRVLDVDGHDCLRRGDRYVLSCIAYWHTCPKCFAHTRQAVGDGVRCGLCKQLSACSYRNVQVEVPPGGWALDALALLLKNLPSVHPAELPNEQTLIDLRDWRPT